MMYFVVDAKPIIFYLVILKLRHYNCQENIGTTIKRLLVLNGHFDYRKIPLLKILPRNIPKIAKFHWVYVKHKYKMPQKIRKNIPVNILLTNNSNSTFFMNLKNCFTFLIVKPFLSRNMPLILLLLQ